MAGHAQLKFVMTECSKTQIRLARLNYKNPKNSDTKKVTNVQTPKLWTPEKIAIIILEQCGFYHREMRPKDADSMANSVLRLVLGVGENSRSSVL